MRDHLYKSETDKSPADFAQDLNTVVKKYGFIIGNEPAMNMQKTFSDHGGEVGPEFDLHMIQICKPDKASKSLTANPERSILMPKFVMAFSKDGKTQIRFAYYSGETIGEMVDDAEFPGSLAQTYEKIKSMIDEATAL
jgi:uncharacterized protein (DUF302 family)